MSLYMCVHVCVCVRAFVCMRVDVLVCGFVHCVSMGLCGHVCLSRCLPFAYENFCQLTNTVLDSLLSMDPLQHRKSARQVKFVSSSGVLKSKRQNI